MCGIVNLFVLLYEVDLKFYCWGIDWSSLIYLMLLVCVWVV